ncbi:MAG TPA: GAF domain-containing protein, partial [Planctomycetota bacterium]|nr:GAF domain-containing protein [Planctomycetota bacterium]
RDFPSRLRCRDGSHKDVLIDANALIEEGRFIHSRGFLRDVTEQRQAELRQAVSYGVTRILAEAGSFAEAAPRLLRAIGDRLGWDLGAAWKLDPATQRLTCIDTWESERAPASEFSAATRKMVVSRGMGLPGRAWEEGRVIWCPDVAGEPNMDRRAEAVKEGLRQGVLIPLLMGDDVLGILEFYGRGMRGPEDALLGLAASLGSQIGQFIERKRTESTLSERSKRLIRHQAALLELSGGESSDSEVTLRLLTEVTANTLGVECVGLWFYDEDRKVLACRDRYRRGTRLHDFAEKMTASQIPRFLAAVETSRVLASDHVADDPRLAELAGGCLSEEGISSTLDVCIRQRGKPVGILRLGHVGEPRTWIPEEQDFASSVADRVTLWLSENERRSDEEEIRQLNASLEARVHERTAQLTESLQEQEQFAYSVSHDLRAPLRAMSGFSQALYEDYVGTLDETGREYARRIIDASERMDVLIKDLLAYSRLSRAEIQLERVDPASLIADVLQQLEVERSERRASVDIPEPLLAVKGNALTLTQVILNIISNAFKFVHQGVPPKVVIRTQERGQKVRIWFEDNGIGILPEHQDRIFRIFERLNRQETYPGTGIGLALVRKAMSRMDGTCGVESDGRTGSRFWVELEKG